MDKSEDWKIRLKSVQRVLLQVLALNLAVASAKVAVGVLTNSLSLIADGFHSSLDGVSNIVGMVGVKAAARPPDKNHPYGHQKFETLTSVIIGALILFTAVQIAKEAYSRLAHPATPHISALNVAVIVVTICINIFVSTFEARAARKHHSPVLLADSLQTRSDIFVSAGVLIAMGLIWMGYPIVDPLAAMLVTIAILFSAWLIFKRASDVLLDATNLDPKDVETAALSIDGVHSVEKIRSRGTESQISVDLHIRVHPDISLKEAHEITHDVRRAVEKSTGASDVIIHTEPENVTEGPQPSANS
ncbi:MAG: cation diffusion facilitator family transporter [Armatimonadota bacterium]